MQGEIGDEEFKEYFSQYGDIEDSVVSCMPAPLLAGFALSIALGSVQPIFKFYY